MASEHFCAFDHKAWAAAGLKDYGDFAECVEYVEQYEDCADSYAGGWWYADDVTLTIYTGTFGNYNSPGADSYTYADVYDNADEFRAEVARLEALPEYLPEEGHNWEVVVGNIGTAYQGADEDEARAAFDTYVEQSQTIPGARCYGESVTLFCDSEIEDEYVGPVDQQPDGGD